MTGVGWVCVSPAPVVFVVACLLACMLSLPPCVPWCSLEQVEAFADACFVQLGLAGWQFHWDHAVRRMGCCWPQRRHISLSRYFAASVLPTQPELLRRTLLHELAHALAWQHERATGHGEAWRYWCAELGIEGERATSRVADFTPPHLQRAPRFALCHDETGEVFRTYRRRPHRRARMLRRCFIPGRQAETLGHLVIRELPPAG